MGFLTFLATTVVGAAIGAVVKGCKKLFSSSVDRTAVRTAVTDSYNKETARISETQNINRVLSDFSFELQEKSDEIENKALNDSQVYFNELFEFMQDVSTNNNVKFNINKIKREINKINRDIKGSFKHYLAKRVSIDDSECLRILELDAGNSKENAMKKFGDKVIKEASEELCSKIKKAIQDLQIEITEEIREKVDGIILNCKEITEKVSEFEKLKGSDESKIEQKKLECINKMVSAKCMIYILS